MGLLIEPHALERTKVKMMNKPEKTEPFWSSSLAYWDYWANTNASGNTLMTGSFLPLSGTIRPYDGALSMSSIHHVSHSGYVEQGFVATIPQSGSKSVTGNEVTSFLVESGDVYQATTYKHVGLKFITAAQSESLNHNVSGSTIDGYPAGGHGLEVTESIHQEEVHGVYAFTWPYVSDLVSSSYSSSGIANAFIDNKRQSLIFSKVIFHYGTGSNSFDALKKNAYMATSESLGKSFSSSLITADYMDDVFEMTNNQRYNGTKLVGPGINIATEIPAIDNRPVVEVFETNPNQIVYTSNPKDGNLIVR